MRNIINGGPIPNVELARIEAGEVRAFGARELFAAGRSIILGIPGAFTPVCTKQHVPDFIRNADKFRAAGIFNLVCIAPNDPFVLQAFAQQIDPEHKIEFLSDGNLEFASALNLKAQNRKLFVGWRSERYLMTVNDGIITKVRVEPNILNYSCTRAADAVEMEYTEL